MISDFKSLFGEELNEFTVLIKNCIGLNRKNTFLGKNVIIYRNLTHISKFFPLT